MVKHYCLALLALAPGMAACSSSDEKADPLGPTLPQDAAAADAASTDADATTDTTTDVMPDVDLPDACSDCPDAEAGPIDAGTPFLPASNGTFVTSFQLSSTGTGTVRVDDVSLTDNVGTVQLAGVEHRGVAYLSHEWTEAGYTLFDVISIAQDGSDFAVTYLYCQGTQLVNAYTESFTLSLDWENATGACDFVMQSFETQAVLPRLDAHPTVMDSGITVAGAQIALDENGGMVEVLGSSWELLPFETVDCTECPGGPWYEVHSMLHRPEAGCFGILYLFPDSPDEVMLANVLCLPGFEQPYQMYAASWSGSVPPETTGRRWRLPPGWVPASR